MKGRALPYSNLCKNQLQNLFYHTVVQMSSKNHNNCYNFVCLHNKGVRILYIVNKLVERIKIQTDKNNKSIAEVLRECGLSENTVSTMASRGSWIKSNSLGMIADCLGCSVDYLLSRTDDPNVNHLHTAVEDKQLTEIISIYNRLNTIGQARLLAFAADLDNDNKVKTTQDN